jgi:1,4-dihydroxy-2-naphthoyl-CoA synthase
MKPQWIGYALPEHHIARMDCYLGENDEITTESLVFDKDMSGISMFNSGYGISGVCTYSKQRQQLVGNRNDREIFFSLQAGKEKIDKFLVPRETRISLKVYSDYYIVY